MIPVKVTKISYYPPSKGYAIVLEETTGSNRKLPVIVGSYEAQAIALANEQIVTPRPMTHDLISNILDEIKVDIKEVIITRLVDGTYYAEIVISNFKTGNFKIDSRPSDAVAIALRLGAPIYVSEEVMSEAGVVEESPADLSFEEIRQVSYSDSKKILEDQLQKAIDEEEYEEAAIIRDKLKKIEHKN